MQSPSNTFCRHAAKVPARLGFCAALLAAVLSATPAIGWAVTDADIAALDYGRAHGRAAEGEVAPKAPSFGRLMAQMALAMGVVLGLMGGVLWAARRFLPRSVPGVRGGQIEILATRTLGQRRSLLLVRARDKTLLLGATPAAIQLLSELEEEPTSWADAAGATGVDEIMPPGLATRPVSSRRSPREAFK